MLRKLKFYLFKRILNNNNNNNNNKKKHLYENAYKFRMR